MLSILTTPEILKAQKEYTIRNFHDPLKTLIEHPDWLEIMREVILTEELLSLPQKVHELNKKLEEFREDFESFKKEEFRPLREKVDKIEQDVEVLKHDVTLLKQDEEILKRDVSYIKGELGKVKGWAYEWKIEEHYHAYFDRVLRKARRITFEKLAKLAEDAEEQGLISEDQYTSLLEPDLFIDGLLKPDKKPVVLAVEISHSVFESVIQRVLERVNILSSVHKKEVIPTVIGTEVKDESMVKAEEIGVLVIKAEV